MDQEAADELVDVSRQDARFRYSTCATNYRKSGLVLCPEGDLASGDGGTAQAGGSSSFAAVGKVRCANGASISPH